MYDEVGHSVTKGGEGKGSKIWRKKTCDIYMYNPISAYSGSIVKLSPVFTIRFRDARLLLTTSTYFCLD